MMVIEDSVENVVKSGNINRVIELVENGVDVNNTLCYASETGNIDLIKILIGLGADINKDFNRPLRWALNNGKIEAAKLLIEYGADINSGNGWVLNQASLRWAAANGRLDVVKFLVESGADIHAENDQALRWAAHNGHLDVVRFLIMSGADFMKHQPEMKKLLGVDDLPESKEEIINLLNAAIVINK
jgi:ankyrin repeat protein